MTSISVPEGRVLPILAGAAAGVVIVTSALFAVVGAVRGSDEAADPTAASATSAPTDAADSAGGDDDGDAGAATDGDAGATETEAPTDAEADATATESPTADDPATEDEAAAAAPSDDPSVDPAEISIQVLDAVGDGGAAARALADDLEEAGFNVIVVNGASRGYDVTTVFWTEGQGPGGRAVAATIGTDVASRTPDEVRLSNSVDVHVVVGADRG